uniref:Uncharacterized protein n=1 Tax=Poecilia reticulata TaxID=8081 RepID=A0A3P9P4Q6_POERE
METGQTVVLLNLQNLYESLYDALNQYYVTLGGQKYVDLGLGTHRVKCRVHPKFRLIVIEEKEVVYEQFPIPLINRLEKHCLDINTVLKMEQRDIAKQIQTWVNKFVTIELDYSTIQTYIPGDVFIGYHSDTCSSVILQVTEDKDLEPDDQVNLNKVTSVMLNCATPDSVVRLDKSQLPDDERDHLMKEYVKEDKHRSLGDYIAYHIKQFEHSQVTTFSRLLTAADAEQLQNEIKCDAVKLLFLLQFETEYSFLKTIRCVSFNNVLIVQTEFDEDFQKRNILSSAKYSCINEIKKGLMKDDTKTFVYFVTKLPRMEGGTSYIGFQGGHWTSVHIDDLRRSREFVSDVHFLKNLRISDLFEDPPEGKLYYYYLTKYYTVYFSLISTPLIFFHPAMETEDQFGQPQNDNIVLGDVFDATDLVKTCVQTAVGMLRDVVDSGELGTRRFIMTFCMQYVIFSVVGDPEINWVSANIIISYRHTLWRKIQAVVTPLLANLVSVIDKDCNLDLLLDEGEEMRNLWLHIFSSKEMLSNLCQYFHELFLNTSFGKYMAENVNERLKNDLFERYLHDFVSMTMKVASDDELEVRLLCQALASCIDEVQRQKRDAEKPTLLHIHFAFYSYRQRLQNLSRIISLQPEIVLPLRRNQHRRNCPEMVLDVLAAKACVENLEPQNLHSDALCRQWMRQVKRLQVSMELIFSQHSLRQYGDRSVIVFFFIGNRKVKTPVIADIVFVFFFFKSLKVLERNSDVKVAKPFEAVIENLKSCKQAALDQLFRFGVHCGVCMAEPEEPVDLPCRHMFCLTCIKESLDTGNTSCPTCRRDLPDGFQPCVSEEIRGSLKKNGNFRRRCNGFFIDLLSVVCFKDNKPPSKEVITHLLSYLRIETEHEQVQTKDLSPFDESPDKNPVVRSVILKLLLKFSFDEVQEYLQQHLSTVEDSRFVDEDDKSELYALYINCLEVKTPVCFIRYCTSYMHFDLCSLCKQNEDGGLMDQFLMYGDEYKTVRDAVAKALVDGDGDQIEEALEKCTATRRNITVFVLLALFREVSTLYRSPNASLHPTSETYKAFDDFIEGSDYLCDKEMRDFASALISNKLGGLSAQSDHTPADNVAIELAVHLAVILLTTNNDLLLPLKQLGLFPDNMQYLFLSFYYSLQCGLPMERGKCLECGEEVGGENHAALQGFTPVQDHTRPGHILGDPERRNNPDALDTKNMSLTPFMLVRLVTHLAMLLGTSKNCEIIHPPVEDVVLFLSQHIMKDLEQLTQALAKGADDAVTTTHLILKSLQEPVQTNNQNIDAQLSTKASRNTWETSVAADIMTPKLKILDQLLQEAKGHITNDSRVSSNFILRITFGDDCKFLTSLQQTSEVHSSSVWSCRERLSLLSLTHIIQYRDLKEELPLLWKFMQKETEYRQIMFLPDIVTLQNRLVKKYQNASEQIDGSISDFLQNQKGNFKYHRLKIPEEFCSTDLDLSSPLQYLLPRRQGPGLCATGLVSYLVTLATENKKDLLPLVLSNCQYSLQRGQETISEYDLPRIQQQILTRFLQEKPLITRTGIPTLINAQGKDYESIFKAIKGKIPQVVLPNVFIISRELDSLSDVCEALKIVDLLLGFLSMTGGDPSMPLVTYLHDKLKMDQNIDEHILKALRKCNLEHCVFLWQLLSSLKSENLLPLKRDPFFEHPKEYKELLTEENKAELKGFMSRGNAGQWLLEMHEFILLVLSRPHVTDRYNPEWSVKESMQIYMDEKKEEIPQYVEENFHENLQLSQVLEAWKYVVTSKQEWMKEG